MARAQWPLVGWPDLDSHLQLDSTDRFEGPDRCATWLQPRCARPGRDRLSAMLSATAPIVLLLHGGLDNLSRQDGLALLPTGPGPIVAVVDPAMPAQPGGRSPAFRGRCPLVGDLRVFPSPMGPRWRWVGLAPSPTVEPCQRARNDLLVALDALPVGGHAAHPPWATTLSWRGTMPSRIGWIWICARNRRVWSWPAASRLAGPAKRILTLGNRHGRLRKMSACLELGGRRRGARVRRAPLRRPPGQAGNPDQRSRRAPSIAVRVGLPRWRPWSRACCRPPQGPGPKRHFVLEGPGLRSAIPASSAKPAPDPRAASPPASCWCTGRGQTHSRTIRSIPLCRP